nr:uncharacterized protein LOC109738681 [Aegilops tauschii subsp. strangulata]
MVVRWGGDIGVDRMVGKGPERPEPPASATGRGWLHYCSAAHPESGAGRYADSYGGRFFYGWERLGEDEEGWLRVSLRSANLQAKTNIGKAAQEERELLLGGGEESTIRSRNLQTKAGMTSAAESITESLRRSRQLMVQEVERSANTLSTFDESTSVLRKAEGEYQGHRSLLMCTRGLLSTMQRQDVLDRIILTIGFLIFSLAVLFVVSRRIGLLTLQRKLADAIRSGSVSAGDILGKVPQDGAAPTNAPPVYDEL